MFLDLSDAFMGSSLSQWFLAATWIIGSILLSKIIYWFIGKFVLAITSKTNTRLDDILINAIKKPMLFAIILIGFYVGLNKLTLNDSAQEWISKIYTALITINVTWFLSRIIGALLDEYILPLTKKTNSDLDDQLFPILKRCVTWAIWIIGLIVALNNVGYDVSAMLAGLGIGGLALAMAAQDSVSNFFGGFTIFTDRPFQLGDRIRLNGFDGNVSDIGMRSFRLKTLDGTEVIIPNSKATDSIVENVTRASAKKLKLELGLTYDTTPEKMELAIKILEDIANAEQDTAREDLPAHAYFTTYGDFSLGILLVYYIRNEADYYGTQSKINMEILKRFNENELSFAFPTQTIEMFKKN